MPLQVRAETCEKTLKTCDDALNSCDSVVKEQDKLIQLKDLRISKDDVIIKEQEREIGTLKLEKTLYPILIGLGAGALGIWIGKRLK